MWGRESSYQKDDMGKIRSEIRQQKQKDMAKGEKKAKEF